MNKRKCDDHVMIMFVCLLVRFFVLLRLYSSCVSVSLNVYALPLIPFYGSECLSVSASLCQLHFLCVLCFNVRVCLGVNVRVGQFINLSLWVTKICLSVCLTHIESMLLKIRDVGKTTMFNGTPKLTIEIVLRLRSCP